MVAHEKRNSAQLFCAVPTRNDLALSSLLFPAQPTQKLGYPPKKAGEAASEKGRRGEAKPLLSCRAGRSPKNVSSKDRSAGVPNGT